MISGRRAATDADHAAGGRRAASSRHRPPALVVALAAVTATFFALPVIGIVLRAPWGSLLHDLTTPAALDALRLSLVCSTLAMLLAVAFGTPLAWVLARVEFPGRSVVRGLVLLPMVMPPVVGGIALLSAFSANSVIGGWLHDTMGIQLTFSAAGVVMAESFVAMPFFVITVEAALRTADRSLEDAAANLGGGRLAVFGRVTLPLVGPSIAAGAVLAWARALGEFGATITFAGNIAGVTRTLPLAIYLRTDADQDTALALSLLLMAVSLAVIVALRERWLPRR